MELQELVAKTIAIELRFPLTPRFTDVRGGLIETIVASEGLPNWSFGDQNFQVHDQGDSSVLLGATAGNITASFENVDLAECLVRTERFLTTGLDALNPKEVSFVGVRSFCVAPTDDFDQLNVALISTLAGGARALFEPFGHAPSDSGWVFEFRGTDPEHLLRVGPMKQEQAITLPVFRDKDPAKFAPQFLFLDLDRFYANQTFQPDAAIERCGATLKRNVELAEHVTNTLRSML